MGIWRLVSCVVAAIFIASFFLSVLPVKDAGWMDLGIGRDNTRGYSIAFLALVLPLISLFGDVSGVDFLFAFALGFGTLANLWFTMTWALILTRPALVMESRRGFLIAFTGLVSSLLVTVPLLIVGSHLREGYYVWAVSVMVLALLVLMMRRSGGTAGQSDDAAARESLPPQ